MCLRLTHFFTGLFLLFLLPGCGGGSGSPDNDQTDSGNLSESATLISHVSTQLDGNRMENILAPAQDAVIATINLADANAKVVLDVSGEALTITPSGVSLEQQTITFRVPANVIDGNLSVLTGTTATSAIAYRVFVEDTPVITGIEPSVVSPGDTVTVTGSHLPEIPLDLVFENQQSDLTLNVTPFENQFSFTVPVSLQSGYLNLQVAQFATNKLYLAVKRYIDVQVSLAAGLSLNAPDISFVLGGFEYFLDMDFAASIPVDNGRAQYIHAMLDRHDDSFPVLYSAVVLPDDTDVITINARSTAIAWVLMGMGSAVMEGDAYRSLYDRVSSSTKVQALAAYIETLQQQDFSSWAGLEDVLLKQKYQDALQDLLQAGQAPGGVALKTAAKTDSFITITQDTENNNIYVDDIDYSYYPIYQQHLKDGSVSIVNDTKLFLSVEARRLKDNSIINEYEHIDNIVDTSAWSLVGPKGWGLLGIASSKKLELEGEDARLEIVIGALQGTTDKLDLSHILVSRVFIDGVATPALNMLLSTLIDQNIPSGSLKNVINAMNNIYGSGFLADLTVRLTDKNADWINLTEVFITTPLMNGYNACFSEPIREGCREIAAGLAWLAGVPVQNTVHKQLLDMMVDTAKKRIIKKSAALVPVVGWIASAAFFIHDNIFLVADSASIIESIADMKNNPNEINVDVEFALDIQDVSPLCIGVPASGSFATIEITGEGFVAEDGSYPSVYIGWDQAKTEIQGAVVNAEGTQIVAQLNPQGFMAGGITFSYPFVGYDEELLARFDNEIEFIDEHDDRVFLNEISPLRGESGSIVTLSGCGWIPLNDIQVHFKTETDYTTAEIVSSSIDTLQVRVPDEAVSGMVYVTAGQKTTGKLYFSVDPFSLKTADVESLIEGEDVNLQGKMLDQAEKINFIDSAHNTVEGVILSSQYYSVQVQVPAGLQPGPVRILAEQANGRLSNEIIRPKNPLPVIAEPQSSSFQDSLLVTLTQPEGMDIFYRIDEGEEQQYNTPFSLNSNDAGFEYFTLWIFSRVTFEGVSFDSDINEYQYIPCAANEKLENEICVVDSAIPVELANCPLSYDISLDQDNNLNYSINQKDKNNDGFYEDYIYCAYFGSGQLQYETPYVNDVIHGIKKIFFESGQLRFETEYSNGLIDGSHNQYYESGQLYVVTPYNQGTEQGTRYVYYETGQLYFETPYVDGEKHGEEKIYYNSGQLDSVVPYLAGAINGDKKQYYESGQLQYDAPFLDNKINGVETVYYETGIVKTETPYVAGAINGTKKSYFESGQKEYVTPYLNGKKNGTEQYYTSTGYLGSEIPYVDGKAHGAAVHYWSVGTIQLITPFINGLITGEQKGYSETGVLISCDSWDSNNYLGSCMPS